MPIEFEGMIAVGLAMRSVIRQIRDAAAVDIPVLITGETGTGKDLVAAAIHRQSGRKDKAYVPVNMGAMAPELIASEVFGHEKGAFTGAADIRQGIFEQASGGTVFLDEIATMDEKTQISLLRVLEEKAFRRVGGAKNIGVDVRIIAATNEELETKVAEKRFREDLFYRLNVFQLRGALRERVRGRSRCHGLFLSQFRHVRERRETSLRRKKNSAPGIRGRVTSRAQKRRSEAWSWVDERIDPFHPSGGEEGTPSAHKARGHGQFWADHPRFRGKRIHSHDPVARGRQQEARRQHPRHQPPRALQQNQESIIAAYVHNLHIRCDDEMPQVFDI